MSTKRIQLSLPDEVADALEHLARDDSTQSTEVIWLIEEKTQRGAREEGKS